jgi:hypothetical protein
MANTKKGNGKSQVVKNKTVSQPISKAVVSKSGNPKNKTTSNGVIISNTEHIYYNAFRLASEGAGTSKRGWYIGPGRTGTFSGGRTFGLFWATSIAQNYAMYRFKKAILHFRPRVPTTFEGTHTLGVLYDDEDYQNWLASSSVGLISQAGTSVTGPFWECMSLTIDVKRMHTRVPWFLYDPQVDAITNNARATQAYGAYFAWETVNTAITQDTYLGDWFLEYEIEFIHPTPAAFSFVPPTPTALLAPFPDPDNPDQHDFPLPPMRPKPSPPAPKPPQNEAEELEY